MDNRPIGVFDSGVGGLTVVREIVRKLSREEIIYFGDTARFPYGLKKTEELQQFVFEIIDFLEEQDVKLIVIACNSASAAALEVAQEHWKIPIIGVVEPGARAAVLSTRNRKVGVIGTTATIESQAYVRAIYDLSGEVEVFQQACPEFADYVENGTLGGERVKETIEDRLGLLVSMGVDSLILGCTHYPLLSELIGEVMGEEVTLISSAEEAAQEVAGVLERRKDFRENSSPPTYRFVSTGSEKSFLRLGPRFLGWEIGKVERVNLAERTLSKIWIKTKIFDPQR